MLRGKRRYLRYVFRMEFHQQREQLDLIQRLPLCSTERNRLPKDPIISESQWPIQTFRWGGGVIYRFSQGLRRRSRLYSYSLLKEKIKSCNAKRGRQRERQKINRSQEPTLKIQVKTRLELTLFFKNNSVNSAVCHPLLDWPILTPETLVGLLADNVGGMTSWKQIWST